jgi:hypothetical protein
MARALIVSILADGKQFGAELDKAAGKTRAFSKAAGVAGLAIAGGLAYGLEKSVKAAMSAQEATATMDQAFHNAGLSAQRYGSQIDAVTSTGRNLGFMNDDMRNSLTTLITSTGNAKAAFGELGAAENLARAQSIPLSTAAGMLAKANTGSTRALKALGLQMAAVKTNTIEATAAQTVQVDQIKAAFGSTSKLTAAQIAQEDHEIKLVQLAHAHAIAQAAVNDKSATGTKIVALLNAKMGNMADAYSKTAAGGMLRFKAQMNNIGEQLGKVLLPALVKVTGWLSTAAGWLSKHTTIAKLLVVGLGALSVALMAAGIAAKVSSIYTELFVAAEEEATLASQILSTAMAAMPWVALAAAVVFLAYEIYTHWGEIKTFFLRIWADIKHIFDDALNWLEGHWKLFLGLPGLVWQYWGPISAFFTGIWDDIKQAFSDAISWVADHWQYFLGLPGLVYAQWGTLSGWFSQLWDGITGAFGSAISWIEGRWSALIGWMENMIRPLVDAYNALAGWATGNIPDPHTSSSSSSSVHPAFRGRAAGGPVFAGHPYLVGEHGPELFMPSGSGSIKSAGSFPHGGHSHILQATVPVYLDGTLITKSTHRGALRDSYRGNEWAA